MKRVKCPLDLSKIITTQIKQINKLDTNLKLSNSSRCQPNAIVKAVVAIAVAVVVVVVVYVVVAQGIKQDSSW